MGNAEAHVSCGILPWSAAQGRYLIQQIFLFCAWIKNKQEKRNLLQQMLSLSWQSLCLGLVLVQGGAQLLEEFNKWETLNYYIPSIQVLIWGNIKEMCLCLWCQWAWRLKDFRNKSILKALSDIFHPELEGNQYMVEDFHMLSIHLRKRDNGTKSSNYRAYSQMSHGIEDIVVWTEDQGAGFQTEQDVGFSTPRDTPRLITRKMHSGRPFYWASLPLE